MGSLTVPPGATERVPPPVGARPPDGDSDGVPPAVARFLQENPAVPTPFLAVDLDVVEERYRRLVRALPAVRVLYAVKANPAREILQRLADCGSSFDVASPGEIERCLKLGVDPSRLAYGNTIKKERDIAHAFASGITTFAVDADAELAKVTRQAPGSTVTVRIGTDGRGADWPLSRKFGCGGQSALRLLRRAAGAGHPVTVSFHVGSQQRDPHAWDRPLAEVAAIVGQLRAEGVTLSGVNLGGGLPSRYREPVPEVETYGENILHALRRHLGDDPGEVCIEPGRYLVGDAGLIEAEVVLVTRRETDGTRWVYLDIGLFNGLTEALGEAIRYRLRAPEGRGVPGPVVLAGPSCDSVDVLYEQPGTELPVDLQVGDRIQLLSAGAYTSSYSSVWFNGFEPLRCITVSGADETVGQQ